VLATAILKIFPEAQFAEGTDRVLRRFECPVVSHD